MEDRIFVLIQGPFHTDLKGRSTSEVLQAINALPQRDRIFLAYALWEDESDAMKAEVARSVDEMISVRKPPVPGSCHRKYQQRSVSVGLKVAQERGFRYALKTRSDMMLSSKFMDAVLNFAASGSEKLLVTNLHTRYEPFHISDMIMASTVPNLQAFFRPARVYYEDAFSPEVEFSRVFIRTLGLKYHITLHEYLRFLRDWVELVDFNEMDLLWIKKPDKTVKQINRHKLVMLERDWGPLLTRLITRKAFVRLQNTRMSLRALGALLLISDATARMAVQHLPFLRYEEYGVHNTQEYTLKIEDEDYESEDTPERNYILT